MGAVHYRLKPDFQFRDVKWLGYIVIRPRTEGTNFIGQLPPLSKHQNWYRYTMLRPQLADQIRAFDTRQRPIQDDCVIGIRHCKVQPCDAVSRSIELMPPALEILENRLGNPEITVNDKKAHVRTDGSREAEGH